MENVERMTYEELKKHKGTIIKKLELNIKEFEQWSEEFTNYGLAPYGITSNTFNNDK